MSAPQLDTALVHTEVYIPLDEEVCPGVVVTDDWSSSLISQTPITIYQDAVDEAPGVPPRAPRKCKMFLCRSQTRPSGPLREEWSLDPWMTGSWGYVFKYEVGELWVYQLGEGESLDYSTPVTVLDAEDWGVMKLMVRMMAERKEENPASDGERDATDKETQTEVPTLNKEEKEEENAASDGERGATDKETQTEVPTLKEEEKEVAVMKDGEEEEEEENVASDGERDATDKETQTEVPTLKEEEKEVAVMKVVKDGEEGEEDKENGKRLYDACEKVLREKRPKMGVQFDDLELAKTKIILAAVWPSKSTTSGKWFTQASVRSLNSEGKRSADLFVLERFNSECGLFRTVLVIPATEWLDRMLGVRDKITSLFQTCRNWKDSLVVRKALTF